MAFLHGLDYAITIPPEGGNSNNKLHSKPFSCRNVRVVGMILSRPAPNYFKKMSRKRLRRPANRPETPLLEGQDYYMDGGYMVFTASYLRRRGYCCGSGCRHCPYKDSQTGRTARS